MNIKLKILWGKIQEKLFKLLSMFMLLLARVFVRFIYVILFGGILAFFAIPIVLLFKLI
jgi:hypothetical protein